MVQRLLDPLQSAICSVGAARNSAYGAFGPNQMATFVDYSYVHAS
jgi:hypothetical protein